MRKAKRRCQQLVAAAMCVGMLAGMVPTQAFAEEAQPAAAVAQQEQGPAQIGRASCRERVSSPV